jgi:hypothetical protein
MSTWSRIGKIALVCAFTIGVGAWVVGCKQGEGDRCQVDDDCASGLVCNRATQSCAKTNGGGIDANILGNPPIDAPEIDATVDAMIDAPDAM